MDTLAACFPDLLSALVAELEAVGNFELSEQLRASFVRVVTFDRDSRAGIIALEPPQTLRSKVEDSFVGGSKGVRGITVGRAYLEINGFGRIVAIEIIGPSDDLAKAMISHVRG